ncbi:putative secreted protein [Wickerhamomyces ciferrii]|uniref:Secreted protein n=1 Tax=Wickerhamomyces ciferrii (strain ATCC 14091 / BCRC 22168 / CBS 111 / JCM 3599 / NBRC 0793 / NRRL Y-1031 F-60-10) TaxID=1206466 RepID=K0KMI3_WICCF|nr:uncharacterized protein BN7_2960 [Wickerhamomyces ciferrii]CCH43412.1 putative secreted protein [Wickerhamomyces ciferrii]
MLFKTIALYITLLSSIVEASPKHQQHQHGKQIEGKNVSSLFKRGSSCKFPTDKGLVAVQKNGKNGGWAMHNDQECTSGSWCPYACPPGQLMGQWDPDVKTYSYPGSQNGGIWCNDDGEIEEKRQGSYCVSGAGTVSANNKVGENVAFCQTVLPGNEEMLIPTNVDGNSKRTLAVPGSDYWAGTAAHFYINPPGVSVDDGCKWGSKDKPQGNWAPYVAGANQNDNKDTFVKIGWNPIYLEQDTPFRNEKPEFGIRIKCDDDSSCSGGPCEIDPSKDGVNGVNNGKSKRSTSGAGGADFCVVTAKNGAKASIEVFKTGGGGSSSNKKRHEHAGHQGNKVTTTETVFQTVTVN